MGWASGATLMSNIAFDIKKAKIDKETKRKIYRILCINFEDNDCDNLMDCEGEDAVLDEVLKELGYLGEDHE